MVASSSGFKKDYGVSHDTVLDKIYYIWINY